MADIKLIALDLDGTLLTTDKKISQGNLAALKAAQQQGVKVVLTTGRPLKAMEFFLHELGTDGQVDEYTITFNGGLVQRNTGEILDKTVFVYDDVARIFEETEKLGLPLDAIDGGLVYQIQSDQVSLYAEFNPALLKTFLAKLPTISASQPLLRNRWMQPFLILRPNCLTSMRFSNHGKCCWNGHRKMSTRRLVWRN